MVSCLDCVFLVLDAIVCCGGISVCCSLLLASRLVWSLSVVVFAFGIVCFDIVG